MYSKNLAKAYIGNSFQRSFWTMGLTLFVISSIIVLIKVANMSVNIELGVLDFSKIYLYLLPEFIFFIIPVIFFISAVIGLSKMSLDSEILAMFSFGLKMRTLYGLYWGYAILLLIFLLILSIGIVPIASHLKNTFLEQKRLAKNINIANSSDFGQKFGDWFIFVNKDSDNALSNIVLFQNQQANEQIIIARNINMPENFALQLTNGKAFYIADKAITEVVYDELFLGAAFSNKNKLYSSIIEYWWRINYKPSLRSDLFSYILFSLLPLISIPAIIGIGLLKPRISKNRSVWYAFLYIFVFAIAVQIITYESFEIILAFTIAWFLLSYALYYGKVSNIFN